MNNDPALKSGGAGSLQAREWDQEKFGTPAAVT
jgi:hypothetical protein